MNVRCVGRLLPKLNIMVYATDFVMRCSTWELLRHDRQVRCTTLQSMDLRSPPWSPQIMHVGGCGCNCTSPAASLLGIIISVQSIELHAHRPEAIIYHLRCVARFITLSAHVLSRVIYMPPYCKWATSCPERQSEGMIQRRYITRHGQSTDLGFGLTMHSLDTINTSCLHSARHVVTQGD